jgi:hypothetical protein
MMMCYNNCTAMVESRESIDEPKKMRAIAAVMGFMSHQQLALKNERERAR